MLLPSSVGCYAYPHLFLIALDLLKSILQMDIAMLLFALKNSMSLMTENPKINNKMSPEQSLLFLKEQLELGMITEEDYQAQRNDIISKL